MSHLDPLLERHRAFAATDAREQATGMRPRHPVMILTCLDPRVDPAAVLDPAATVRADVERLLSAPEVSRRITVSGHVHDVATGLVQTVVAPAAPHPLHTGAPA